MVAKLIPLDYEPAEALAAPGMRFVPLDYDPQPLTEIKEDPERLGMSDEEVAAAQTPQSAIKVAPPPIKEGETALQQTGGALKSVGKQLLRFGPNVARTLNQAIGFGGGLVESGAKAAKETTGWTDMFAPYEQIGKAVKQFGLGAAKDVKTALEHPFFSLPKEKQQSLWDNPQYLLDPEWVSYNAGEAIQSLGLVIAGGMAAGPAGAIAVGGGMEGLDLYDELIGKGTDQDRAATASIAFGVVTGILNKIGLDKIVEKGGATAIARLMKRLVAGSTEAVTEYAEEPFQAAFGALAEKKSVGEAARAAFEALKNVDVIPGAFLAGAGMARPGGKQPSYKDQKKEFTRLIEESQADYEKQREDNLRNMMDAAILEGSLGEAELKAFRSEAKANNDTLAHRVAGEFLSQIRAEKAKQPIDLIDPIERHGTQKAIELTDVVLPAPYIPTGKSAQESAQVFEEAPTGAVEAGQMFMEQEAEILSEIPRMFETGSGDMRLIAQVARDLGDKYGIDQGKVEQAITEGISRKEAENAPTLRGDTQQEVRGIEGGLEEAAPPELAVQPEETGVVRPGADIRGEGLQLQQEEGRAPVEQQAGLEPAAAIALAAHQAATSPLNEVEQPTEAQKKAGNYKKGRLQWRGLDISIENPAGSTREGVDRTGKPWKTELQHHYGYIRRTEAKDGDQLDVFVGPNVQSDKVFVVNQVNPDTGTFDEHKAMVGFDTPAEAAAGYLSNYAPDWKGLGNIVEMTAYEFKTWSRTGDLTKPIGEAAPQAKVAAAPQAPKSTTLEKGTPVTYRIGKSGSPKRGTVVSVEAGEVIVRDKTDHRQYRTQAEFVKPIEKDVMPSGERKAEVEAKTLLGEEKTTETDLSVFFLIVTDEKGNSRLREPASIPPTKEEVAALERINFLNKKPAPEEGARAALAILAGPPGAGKTSSTEGKNVKSYVPIDPDLTSWQAKRTGKDRTAFSDHAEKIADATFDRAMEEYYDVLWDGMGATFTVLDSAIQRAVDQGRTIDVTFIHVDPITSRVRALVRYNQQLQGPNPQDARNVPDSVVLKGANRPLPVFLELFKKYKGTPDVMFTLIDNSRESPLDSVFQPVKIIYENEILEQKTLDKWLEKPYIKVDKGDGSYTYEWQEKHQIDSFRNAESEITKRVNRSLRIGGFKELPEAYRAGQPEGAQRPEAGPRPPVLAPTEKFIPGDTSRVYTAGHKEGLPVQFALMEASDVVPSHDAMTFGKNEKYPEGVQERTYHADRKEQAKVIDHEENMKVRLLVNTNPDAINGPPIVTPEGVVLGGNSRAMTIQRAYIRNTTGKKYKSVLAKHAKEFGLTTEQVNGMTWPMLVRVHAPEKTDRDTLHRLASAFNVSPAGAMGTEAKTASMGRNVSTETLTMIGDALTEQNVTLRKLLEKKTGTDILRRLVEDGVLADTETNALIAQKTGLLNDAGKDLIEKVVMGSVIDDADTLSAAPKIYLLKIEKGLTSMAVIKGRGEAWDITRQIKDAIDILTDMKARDIKMVDEYVAQIPMFEKDKIPGDVIALATALKEKKPNQWADAIKGYAGDAKADVKNQTPQRTLSAVSPFRTSVSTPITSRRKS